MNCFWCGKENTNLEIDETGQILKHYPCGKCQLEASDLTRNESKQVGHEKTLTNKITQKRT